MIKTSDSSDHEAVASLLNKAELKHSNKKKKKKKSVDVFSASG